MKTITTCGVAAVLVLLLAAGAAAQGRNVMSVSMNQTIGTIDPAKITDWTESVVLVNVYDGLVRPAADGTMQPRIAERWEVSPDGRVYTFWLRRGIRFHDGREVTAEDVRYSMQRMLALGQGYSWLWSELMGPEDVTALDRYTVQFRLREAFAPFVSTLPWLGIVNSQLLAENQRPGPFGPHGDYGQEFLLNNDAGSGPYRFQSWERGREIVLARFDDYFLGWRQGAIDEVRLREIFNDATVIAEMRTGALTMADHYRALETYQTLGRQPGITIETAQTGEILYLKMNTQKPPLDDLHVRRAISWAFDYETFVTQLEPGAVQARGPVPQVIPGHADDVFQYKRDLARAREELARAGYGPGELNIVFTYVEGFELGRRVGLLFQANMADVGINVTLQPQTWGRITDLAATVETTPHVTMVYSAANYPDPDNYLFTAFHSSAAGTWMSMEWLQDPEVDALIERGRVSVDPAERERIYRELQQRLVDLAPSVYVYSLMKRYGLQSYVRGFEFVPVMSFEYDFHKMWFER